MKTIQFDKSGPKLWVSINEKEGLFLSAYTLFLQDDPNVYQAIWQNTTAIKESIYEFPKPITGDNIGYMYLTSTIKGLKIQEIPNFKIWLTFYQSATKPNNKTTPIGFVEFKGKLTGKEQDVHGVAELKG